MNSNLNHIIQPENSSKPVHIKPTYKKCHEKLNKIEKLAVPARRKKKTSLHAIKP